MFEITYLNDNYETIECVCDSVSILQTGIRINISYVLYMRIYETCYRFAKIVTVSSCTYLNEVSYTVMLKICLQLA